MMWMENRAVNDPKEIDHMLNVFLLCKGQVPGYGFKRKTHCVLYCILLPFFYCILLSTGFTVKKIILCQYFCFIMLLFLIFQNIRNFILLCVMAESASFLEALDLLSKNRIICSEITEVTVFQSLRKYLPPQGENQLL